MLGITISFFSRGYEEGTTWINGLSLHHTWIHCSRKHNYVNLHNIHLPSIQLLQLLIKKLIKSGHLWNQNFFPPVAWLSERTLRRKQAENREICSTRLLKTTKWSIQQEYTQQFILSCWCSWCNETQTLAQQFKQIQKLWSTISSMTFLLFTHATWITFTSFPNIPVIAQNLLIFWQLLFSRVLWNL